MYAARSAGWFWKVNNLASYADKEDIKGMTKKINGGYIGLEARQALYNKIMQAIK
jgi:putative chitinase